MDETIGRDDGSAEVIATLRAFALTRLSPDAEAAARMRARVMREAELAIGRSSHAHDEPAPRRVIALRPRRGHRVATALLAATIGILGLAGGTLAARPGGPLYGARVWIETVFLPADPGRRVDSELHRLDDRLTEASAAAAAGDEAAAAAALDAYRTIVNEAMSAAGTDEDLQARLELVLGKHLTVLEALLDAVPPQAQDALERAIDNSGKAVDRIGGPGGPGSPGAKPGSDKPTTPSAKPTPKPGGQPAATSRPTPAATPKPPPDKPNPPPKDSPPDDQSGQNTDG